MKFVNKNYKRAEIKNYINKNNLFFFFLNTFRNINDWIIIQQNLKSKNFNCFKVFQNIIKKTLDNSIYINFNVLSSQILVLLKSKQHLFTFLLDFGFKFLSLNIVAIKLNNKVYHKNQLKNNYYFYYFINKLLLFQFKIVNWKKNSK